MRSSLRAWTPRDSRLKLKLRGQSSVIKGIERSIYPIGWVSRDAANCGCNLITPLCDETVTGSHQILHTSSRRILCHRKTKPIQSIRRSLLVFANVSSPPGAMRRMDRALTSVLALLYPDWSKPTEAKIRHPEDFLYANDESPLPSFLPRQPPMGRNARRKTRRDQKDHLKTRSPPKMPVLTSVTIPLRLMSIGQTAVIG